jgi:hypothetical protein
VRIGKHAAAKALEQLAGGIKLQDWRVGLAATDAGGDAGRHGIEAAVEDPNIAVAVDVHTDDLAKTAAIHAVEQRRPAFDKAIGIGQLSWLGVLRRLGARSRSEARNKNHSDNEHCSESSSARHSDSPRKKT